MVRIMWVILFLLLILVVEIIVTFICFNIHWLLGLFVFGFLLWKDYKALEKIC